MEKLFVTPVNYPLKFTIASRVLLSKKLKVIRFGAFGRASFSDFHDLLPPSSAGDLDGYLIQSIEVSRDFKNEISVRDGRLVYVLEIFPRYLTHIDGTFEDFLALMSAKTRSTLRRKVRRFSELSDNLQIDWRTYETPVEIEEFFTQALPLAQVTYQARLFDGALPSADSFRQQALKMAGKGELRAYLLFLNSKPVAYLYTPLKGGVFIYAYLGYNREVAKLSPGIVLQYLVLEKIFSDKSAEYFDFTEGGGSHKALFATESKNCCNVLYLENTLRNRLLFTMHRLWNQGVLIAKRGLEKLNLNIGVKKIFQATSQSKMQR